MVQESIVVGVSVKSLFKRMGLPLSNLGRISELFLGIEAKTRGSVLTGWLAGWLRKAPVQRRMTTQQS